MVKLVLKVVIATGLNEMEKANIVSKFNYHVISVLRFTIVYIVKAKRRGPRTLP